MFFVAPLTEKFSLISVYAYPKRNREGSQITENAAENPPQPGAFQMVSYPGIRLKYGVGGNRADILPASYRPRLPRLGAGLGETEADSHSYPGVSVKRCH